MQFSFLPPRVERKKIAWQPHHTDNLSNSTIVYFFFFYIQTFIQSFYRVVQYKVKATLETTQNKTYKPQNGVNVLGYRSRNRCSRFAYNNLSQQQTSTPGLLGYSIQQKPPIIQHLGRTQNLFHKWGSVWVNRPDTHTIGELQETRWTIAT